MRDTAALADDVLAITVSEDDGVVNAEHLRQLCGLASLAGVREPFSAVRLLAESIGSSELLRYYGVSLEAALEASEHVDDLTPHGICCALATRRGFQVNRSDAPDAHRAGLSVLQDVVDGVVGLHVWPDVDVDAAPLVNPTPSTTELLPASPLRRLLVAAREGAGLR